MSKSIARKRCGESAGFRGVGFEIDRFSITMGEYSIIQQYSANHGFDKGVRFQMRFSMIPKQYLGCRTGEQPKGSQIE